MGIIMSALAGAGDSAISALDLQEKTREQEKLQANQAALTLQNEQSLLQTKQQLADSLRQQQTARIDAAAQPIIDQTTVGRAQAARAAQLPDYDPSDTSGPASFHGDARQALAAIQALPDGPDKQAAMSQLQVQVDAGRANVADLKVGDLTDAERARFTPTGSDLIKARIQAGVQTGDISLEKAMENQTKEGAVDAKIAMVDQQLDKAKLLHDAYSARTEAQFNAAMAKLQQANTLTPEMETVAQGIASGKLAPLSGYALRTPGASMIMARVLDLNPEYDATAFGTRQKAEKDFATGKNGNSTRSYNVAMAHLDTLSQLSDALDNGNTQLINRLGNAVSTQTGSAAPTNFDAAKQLVGDEIVKAVTGSAGALGDRERAQQVLDKANSPAQLKGAIQTYLQMMAGQVEGSRRQYHATTGKDDFEDKYLSPEVSQILKRFGGTPALGPAVRVNSDADYDAVPSGALFIGPDGQTRRKP